MEIALAHSDAEIEVCFDVMAQLRPHLARTEFVRRVRDLMAGGYELASLRAGGRVVAVAGYRITDMLSRGRHMYVDDLVTDEAARSQGHGGTLLDWLGQQARARGCVALHLDSGVQRHDAHRFYLRSGMSIVCHHFRLPLDEQE